MSKRLIAILTFVLAVGLTAAAYAEVQNVKVSGDLLISGVSRQQFDLNKGVKGDAVNDSEDMFLSQTRLRVDADLTDNVMTTIRLINERNWDEESVSNTDIDLDLAFITLKEFLYSPLSLTIGRQELRYGNGLVIGAANTYATGSSTTVLGGVPSDLSLRKAFDGIKAVLNYDPLVIDLVYAKINESNTKRNTDTNLYGVNAAYAFNNKLKGEAYLFNKNNSTTDDSQNIKTIGMLVSALPAENLATSLEFAYQFGQSATAGSDEMRAFALQAYINYVFAKVKYTPMVGAKYTLLSGDKKPGDSRDTAWDAMYYDQFSSPIAFAILPFTDVQAISLNAGIKPTEDTRISAIWANYRLAESLPGGLMQSNKVDGAGSTYLYAMQTNKKDLGNEFDLMGTYDYTEDVQLGLTFGYYKPGKAFAENNRRQATELIGSMKVSF